MQSRKTTRPKGLPPALLLRCLRTFFLIIALAAGATLVAPSAGATPINLCGIQDVAVPESSSTAASGIYLTPGRGLPVSGTGSMWAGDWWIGANDPKGWGGGAGPGYPQPTAPKYSLLARVGTGAWSYIGEGGTILNSGTTTEQLQFRVNDNVVGNGSGQFTATFQTCDLSDAPSSQYSVNSVVGRMTQKCLDARSYGTANGTPIQQWRCLNGTNQQWTVRPATGGSYQIVGRASGKCLDARGYGTANGTPIQLWTCLNDGANQRWRFSQTSSGDYEVVGEASGRCLDVTGYGTADGAQIQLWTCLGGTNQRWAFPL